MQVGAMPHDLTPRMAYVVAMSLQYPVAPNADLALASPLGFAVREREAAALAGAQIVEFITEWVGPAWPGPEAATQGLAARLPPGESGWWSILPVVGAAPGKGRTVPVPPVKPVFRDGRRWPQPDAEARPATAWRLSIRYWRVGGAPAPVPSKSARKVRRDPEAGGLENAVLRALAEQPLRPEGPQRALDIGLFEFRPPDAPHIIMPDE